MSWGDGTATADALVDGDAVSASHTYDASGSYVAVVTVDHGVRSASAAVSIEVAEPAAAQIDVDAPVVAPGDDSTVTGTHFAPSEEVTVTFADVASVVNADGSGEFSTVVTTPADATDGDYPVVAVGSVSQEEARASVRVEVPLPEPAAATTTLSTDEDAPVVGESFALIAEVTPQYAAGSVEIREGGDVMGSAPVAGGSATVDVRPATSGAHTYVAVFMPDDDQAFAGSESSELMVTVRSAPVMDAEVELSTGSVVQGGTVAVDGRGFAPHEQVRIELHSEPVLLSTVAVGASGAFSIEVEVPSSTPVGEHTLVVVGAESGLSADAPLTVLAAPGPGDHADGGGGGIAGGDTDGDTGGIAGGDGLSSTGAGPWWPAAVALALLAAGAGAILVRKRNAVGLS